MAHYKIKHNSHIYQLKNLISPWIPQMSTAHGSMENKTISHITT